MPAVVADWAKTVQIARDDISIFNPPLNRFGTKFLTVRGPVREHVDDQFPRWAYVWIVRCNDRSATLRLRDEEPLLLRRGMIIELDSWRQHRVAQKDSSVLIWLSYDVTKQVPFADAKAHFRECLELTAAPNGGSL